MEALATRDRIGAAAHVRHAKSGKAALARWRGRSARLGGVPLGRCRHDGGDFKS